MCVAANLLLTLHTDFTTVALSGSKKFPAYDLSLLFQVMGSYRSWRPGVTLQLSTISRTGWRHYFVSRK